MKIHVLFVIYFFSGFLFSSAQDNDSGRVYVLFPQEADPYSFSGSIGATTTFVPRPIAEEEIRQIPILDANVRYNLPVNFALTVLRGNN